MKQGQFEKHLNLIRKSAHFYATKWNIDYDEVEAQGFLIYCESIDTFDLSKGRFSTHLTWQLKRLNDFCRTYKRQKGELIEDYFRNNDNSEMDSICDSIPANSENITMMEILEIAIDYLSKEAYSMLKWILGRNWEMKGRLKPSIPLAMSKFNYTRKQAEKIWNEIGVFYNTTLLSL